MDAGQQLIPLQSAQDASFGVWKDLAFRGYSKRMNDSRRVQRTERDDSEGKMSDVVEVRELLLNCHSTNAGLV